MPTTNGRPPKGAGPPAMSQSGKGRVPAGLVARVAPPDALALEQDGGATVPICNLLCVVVGTKLGTPLIGLRPMRGSWNNVS